MEIKKYKVAVTEIYRKVVSVEALNEQEAQGKVLDAWKNTEIILDMCDDFDGVEVYTIGEGEINNDGKILYCLRK